VPKTKVAITLDAELLDRVDGGASAVCAKIKSHAGFSNLETMRGHLKNDALVRWATDTAVAAGVTLGKAPQPGPAAGGHEACGASSRRTVRAAGARR
jgi:hypothetical protein